MKTYIIAGMSCIGKTYLTKHQKEYNLTILDCTDLNFYFVERYLTKDEIKSYEDNFEPTRMVSREIYSKELRTKKYEMPNPNYIDDYVNYIKENIGKYDVIFIDTDKYLLQKLNKLNIPFMLVLFSKELKNEWVGREYAKFYENYKKDKKATFNTFMYRYDVFEKFIDELDINCKYKYYINNGLLYLSDLIDVIISKTPSAN